MVYYDGKTKSSVPPCYKHTDHKSKPLPCNMDTCKEECNYRDWKENDVAPAQKGEE